ncbi:MAG: cobalamin biosynthesis protein [Nitrosopumilaceae archaeon]
MIIESILIVAFALGLDFAVGDPKNKFHPTAWIGKLIAKLTPFAKNSEKIGGVILVLSVAIIVSVALISLEVTINLITIDYVSLIISIIVGAILLKTTIAIRGMEKHAIAVVESMELNDIEKARDNLALIVKRNTKDLDKNHVLSGVLESISENTVDGITGPLFYYGLFGLPGAFVYRAINTIDSMIGYKNSIFKNVGWFGANCDKVLNYIPSRLTAFVMVPSAKIIGIDWKNSYQIMLRDGPKTESPNAGYPMAALAGALQTKFEKIDHYSLGDGNLEITKKHIKSAIVLMKVTSILFSGIVTIPTIIALSYLGWWIHA